MSESKVNLNINEICKTCMRLATGPGLFCPGYRKAHAVIDSMICYAPINERTRNELKYMLETGNFKWGFAHPNTCSICGMNTICIDVTDTVDGKWLNLCSRDVMPLVEARYGKRD